MDYLTYTERINYLITLIEKGQVKSPNCIAKRFNCTEKTIRNMINRLREQGHNIIYSKCCKKYILKK